MNNLNFSNQLAAYLVTCLSCEKEKVIETIDRFFAKYSLNLVDENSIAGAWVIQDVYHKAEELGYNLTEEQAAFIFGNIQNYFDATIGINWDTIEYYINEHIKESNNG
jgi:hypothetical protein